MSSDIAIRVTGLSKCYQIYDKPRDRLLQMLMRGRKKFYREFWALKNVSFDVKRGETVGIIGRNGSGKSTLLQLICGTLGPTSGSVEVEGRVAALLELGAGFNSDFTGRENVYLNGSVLGLTRDEIDARFDKIAAFADLGEFIDQPVKTYSSGMYVRLGFAVIAHVDADILIIDEALAVGDVFFTQKCMRFLRKFMEHGTVLFVSHDTGAVQNLCSKAIWLDQGVMRFEGSTKVAAARYLEALYDSFQGSSETKEPPSAYDRGSLEKGTNSERNCRDMRMDFINATKFRNDIEIFAFDPNAPCFGKNGAQITSVALMDFDGRPLSWVVGGEIVTLEVRCLVRSELLSSIIGFFIMDRLGQPLFGDNTYLTYRDAPVSAVSGQYLTARFEFRMPVLPAGDYCVTVAVADGTQLDHVQHHWVHDALALKSHSSSVCQGLIGVPMSRIDLVATSKQ